MATPKVTIHSEIDVTDPATGEVLEWAGKTLSAVEALQFWHIAAENPEPFHLDPAPGDSFEVTVRAWPWS